MNKLAPLNGSADADQLDTKQDVARRLKCSTRTVDAYMAAGRIPFIKIGRTVRFRWSDVIEKLSECRVN
jgi:excisionase family DNA binding protein